MPLIKSFTSAWSRSFDYGGKSTRADYWWFVLADIIVITVLSFISKPLASLYSIAQIVPHLPLAIRRLRDIGKQWTWLLLQVVLPIIGSIWLIVLFCQPSIPG
jgi:uncharacterized membrane protein YhaH (DUF805 family)